MKSSMHKEYTYEILKLCISSNFACFWSSAVFFQNQHFRKIKDTRVSNILDPDQARQNVGPDLDPNCLQKLSADEKSCRWQTKI